MVGWGVKNNPQKSDIIYVCSSIVVRLRLTDRRPRGSSLTLKLNIISWILSFNS
jgi:hypothetical protein